MGAVQEPPTPRRPKSQSRDLLRELSLLLVPSSPAYRGTKSLAVKFASEGLANPYQHVNSKEITKRIDRSHVVDQLRKLWRRIILAGCRDISSPSCMNLAVGSRCASDVGRCGPTWRVTRPHRDEIWSRFGVENYYDFHAFIREISSR